MVVNTALITTKHVDFQRVADGQRHPSRDAGGYPLSGIDEVPAQQSSAAAEQLVSISE